MCGTPEWKWEEDKFAFEPIHKFCKGCYLKDITDKTEDTLPGTFVQLVPAEEAERLREQSQWQ